MDSLKEKAMEGGGKISAEVSSAVADLVSVTGSQPAARKIGEVRAANS